MTYDGAVDCDCIVMDLYFVFTCTSCGLDRLLELGRATS